MNYTAHALPGPTKADRTKTWVGVVRDQDGKIVKSHYHSQHTAGDALAWAHQIADKLNSGKAVVL